MNVKLSNHYYFQEVKCMVDLYSLYTKEIVN